MKKIFWLILIAAGLSACNLPVSQGAVETAIKQTDAAAEISDTENEASPGQDTEDSLSKATETNTPTLSAKDSFISQLEVDSFRLFSAGEDPTDVIWWDYGDSFSQSDARIIYCEYVLSHPAPDEDVEFTIRAVYFGPSGNVYGEVEIQPVVEAGWTDSDWIIGYGTADYDPDFWEVGDYQIQVFFEGEEVDTQSFSITKDTPTPEPTFTKTPEPGAIVDTDSLNIREGPGTMYGIVTGVDRGDLLEITGQAYNCEWLKVKTESGVSGWVSADLVKFEQSCSSIPSAAIPPTPIPLPTSTPVPVQLPTATAQAPSGKTITVKIVNNTGGTLSLNLSGPASYSFTFGTGSHNIKILPGTYTYTAWGCGSSMSGTKNLKKVDTWTFYCK